MIIKSINRRVHHLTFPVYWELYKHAYVSRLVIQVYFNTEITESETPGNYFPIRSVLVI